MKSRRIVFNNFIFMVTTQTVWIARHGNRLDFVNPEWFNTAERRYDPPLSDDGVIQAQQLGKRLKSENINHIFASPFLRAIQTANQVADALDLPIKIEKGLSEWLNPNWMTEMPETHPIDWLEDKYSRIDRTYSSRIVPQYPETETILNQRMGETVKRLVEEFSDDILLVGHGASVVGTTIALVGGNPKINASLCCLVKVVRNGTGWDLEINGDISHLSHTEKVIRFN
jgi:broad specificity phosphatase PhoE